MNKIRKNLNKKLTSKQKKNFNSLIDTILAATVAIANAWYTVDWETFDLKRDWFKLMLSAIIAAGGAISTTKIFNDSNAENN